MSSGDSSVKVERELFKKPKVDHLATETLYEVNSFLEHRKVWLDGKQAQVGDRIAALKKKIDILLVERSSRSYP